MKVYALLGKSGTGKSYKALEVACNNDIDYIIDDGLLIYKNKIIAGVSAKQSKTSIDAVKKAIFNEEHHRECVKNKIKDENIRKILILGTSKKMISQISRRLEIGEVNTVINIEEISSNEEIEKAKEQRKKGNHIIPVSSLEIKSIANGLSINSLKRKIFKENSKEEKILEKTIIRPTFSYRGRFFISKNVLEEIIVHELNKFEMIEKYNKIQIIKNVDSISIYISMNINNPSIIKNCHIIQKNISESLYKTTSINIDEIKIYIHKLKIK